VELLITSKEVPLILPRKGLTSRCAIEASVDPIVGPGAFSAGSPFLKMGFMMTSFL
jgi:hypothetical protein